MWSVQIHLKVSVTKSKLSFNLSVQLKKNAGDLHPGPDAEILPWPLSLFCQYLLNIMCQPGGKLQLMSFSFKSLFMFTS